MNQMANIERKTVLKYHTTSQLFVSSQSEINQYITYTNTVLTENILKEETKKFLNNLVFTSKSNR